MNNADVACALLRSELESNIAASITVELNSMSDKPKTQSALQHFLKRWSKIVYFADPVLLIKQYEDSSDVQKYLTIAQKGRVHMDVIEFHKKLLSDALVKAKVLGGLIIHKTTAGSFPSTEIHNFVPNENMTNAIRDIQEMLIKTVNGGRKSMYGKATIKNDAAVVDVLIDRVIKNMQESNYIECISNDKGEQTVKYNMPSDFMLLCLDDILNCYTEIVTERTKEGAFCRENLTRVIIASKNRKLQKLKLNMGEAEKQLRTSILSEAVATLNKNSKEDCKGWQVSGKHFEIESTTKHSASVLEDVVIRLKAMEERRTRSFSCSSNDDVGNERYPVRYSRSRISSLSYRRSRCRSYTPLRRRRSWSRSRSITPGRCEVFMSRSRSHSPRRRRTLRGRSRSYTPPSRRTSSSRSRSYSPPRRRTSRGKSRSYTPPRRRTSSSRSRSVTTQKGRLSRSKSKSYTPPRRRISRGTSSSDTPPRRRVSRSRSRSFTPPGDTSPRSNKRTRHRRRSGTKSRSLTPTSLNSSEGASCPKRKKRKSVDTQALSKLSKEKSALRAEGVLISQLTGLKLSPTSDNTKALNSLCTIMEKLSVDEISAIPTQFDIETVKLVISLEKMGESKPRSLQGLRNSLRPLCKFVYVRGLEGIGEVKGLHLSKTKTSGVKRKLMRKEDRNTMTVTWSIPKVLKNIQFNLKNILMREESTRIVFGSNVDNAEEENPASMGVKKKKRRFSGKKGARKNASTSKRSATCALQANTASVANELYKCLAQTCKMYSRKWNTTVNLSDTNDYSRFVLKLNNWLDKERKADIASCDLEHSRADGFMNSGATMSQSVHDGNIEESKIPDTEPETSMKSESSHFPTHMSLLKAFVQNCVEVCDVSVDTLSELLVKHQVIQVKENSEVVYIYNSDDAKRKKIEDLMIKRKQNRDEVFQSIENLYMQHVKLLPEVLEYHDDYQKKAANWSRFKKRKH